MVIVGSLFEFLPELSNLLGVNKESAIENVKDNVWVSVEFMLVQHG